MQNNKRVYEGFDILKFICSILIVFLHLNPFTGAIRYFSRAIGNIGVPCFFILSGFLFFEKLDSVDDDNKRLVLIKYLKRMLTLLSFWIIPYFLISDIFWIINGNIFLNISKYIKHILFGGPGFFLWYIVSSIVAVLFVFLIKDIKALFRNCIILVLFLIGTVCTSYSYIIKIQWINSLIDYYTNFFYTFRNGIFFGAPCVYVGMILQRNKRYLSNLYLVIGILLISLILFFTESICLFMHDIQFAVMQISVLLLSVACVILFYNISLSNTELLFQLRKLSFLNYVIHPLYIRSIPLILHFLYGIDYYWYLFYPAQIPVVISASVITGIVLIRLSEKKTFFKMIM